MGAYNVRLQRTASTSASLGSLNANGTTARRGKIYDIMIGSEAAPADNPFHYVYQRCTTVGTSTAVTPFALDPADAACTATAGQLHTVEPTYTANAIMLAVSLNQRATFRWQQDPDRYGIVWPASTNNGIGVQTPTSSAVAITNDIYFVEQ